MKKKLKKVLPVIPHVFIWYLVDKVSYLIRIAPAEQVAYKFAYAVLKLGDSLKV